MSRSSYRETTTSTSEDRDYETRRERERERARASDRYDETDSRHHGRWTAQGEADLAEGSSGYSAPRKSLSRSHSRERFDRDREYDRDNRRSRGFSESYGNIPTPPPMPPMDYYEPHGQYRDSQYGGYGQSHPSYGMGQGYGMSGYGNHYSTRSTSFYHPQSYGSYHPSYSYGSYGDYNSGYGQDTYALSHPSLQRGMHPIQRAFLAQGGNPHIESHNYGGQGYHQSRGFGSYGDIYGQGYGQGQQDLWALSHPSAIRGMHPIQRAFLAQGGHPHVEHHSQSRSLGGMGMGGMGMGQFGGFSHPYHLYELHGFHMTRPHCDIYELGNDYIIEMDLPGHTRDHVDIKLSGNELYVISKPPKREFDWHINERWLGRHNVERKFYLPADVNGSAISPVLANGVLKLILPRTGASTTTTGAATHGKTVTTQDTTTTTTSTTQAVTV